MKFVFPYGVRFREDGRFEVFPAVELSVLGRAGLGIRALFHIDSGATTSILPASDAAALRIDIVAGKKRLVRGIDDSFLNGFQHTVSFNFDGLVVNAPVIFVESAFIPRILGREGLFRRFGILFDEVSHQVGLLERRSERRIIEKIFVQ